MHVSNANYAMLITMIRNPSILRNHLPTVKYINHRKQFILLYKKIEALE